ncbi:FKBP-type peptidyl-prolyl cis-trans isomerase SlpA [hydrothermal vent metagenome]|uniref:peptidylprolyl isomerase n=1 Tax=hydrothermal vent metagenome TaxID=652676 RepID=A0A3B1ACB6_9ZZZZ
MSDIENNLKTINVGSDVTMHFSLSLKDGTVADGSLDEEPLKFKMGDGTLIEGLEMVLYGLKAGDKQTLDIEPRDAFGYPDEKNFHDMPRDEFSDEFDIKEGVIISFSTPSGDEIPGTIVGVGDDIVKVDFNHPLAGHVIRFFVEILDVK